MNSALSLPPKLNGLVHGYLDLKVDGVDWVRRTAGPVAVNVTWWGQDNSQQLFRIGNNKHEKTLCTYEIQTTYELFRHYLVNCESLTLSVVDEHLGSCIGTCEIKHLSKIIGEKATESYYPILNPSTSVIGNLHVGFRLCMNSTSKTIRNTTKHLPASLPSSPIHSQNNVRRVQSSVSFLRTTDDIERDDSITNKLVEKVLNQGQRLRNAMIETILENDPLNTEVFAIKPVVKNPPAEVNLESIPPVTGNKVEMPVLAPSENHHRVFDYLMGADMTAPEEKRALDTLRAFSPTTSMIKLASDMHFGVNTTEQGYDTKNENLCKQPEYKPSDKYQLWQEQLSSEFSDEVEDSNLLKYVDSIKIYIHTLKLNSAGWRRVAGTVSCQTIRPPTFFIEYAIPTILTLDLTRTKAKINTGLNSNGSVRFCSKKILNEVVHFKQQSVHSTRNLYALDLSEISLELKIHSRTVSQRGATPVGIAKYCFADVLQYPNLTCDQELVLLDSHKPLTIGTLKIRIQFGCDKLYFGQEFIDAINCGKENRKLSQNDSLTQQCDDNHTKLVELVKNAKEEPVKINDQTGRRSKITPKIPPKYKAPQTRKRINKDVTLDALIGPFESKAPKLLQGLIYLSEVLYTTDEEKCTFLVCRAFWREDTTSSKLSHHTQRAVFNFRELVPILYDSDFLLRTRNNYLIVEIWENDGTCENLIGICKLPLHQFYVAYRDPRVATHLVESKFPVIGFDGWEDIIDPLTGYQGGQLQALLAIGSEAQLNFLEVSRGLNEPCVVHNKSTIEPIHIDNVIRTETDSEQRRMQIIQHKHNLKTKSSPQEVLKPNTDHSVGIELNNLTVDYPEIIPTVNKHITPVKKTLDKGLQIHGVTTTATQTDEFTLQENLLFKDMAEPVKKIGKFSTDCTETNILKSNLLDTFMNFASQFPSTSIEESMFLGGDGILGASKLLIEQSSQTTVPTEEIPARDGIRPMECDATQTTPRVQETSKLLETLQFALSNIAPPVQKQPERSNGNTQTDSISQKVMINAYSETDGLQIEERVPPPPKSTIKRHAPTFKVHIVIVNAVQLAIRKRRMKNKSKQAKQVQPSTYVSFEPLQNNDFFYTSIVQKTINPKWNQHFECYVPTDLLYDDQKRLIFKVWNKNGGDLSQPNPIADSVIGFAALDLTVLPVGLPSIQGWFNILDFSSRCNGQIKIHLTPLEDISTLTNVKPISIAPIVPLGDSFDICPSTSLLSTTLKRKFSELDEITERLKQRLLDVTHEEEDTENYRDEYVHEFEHDLNTECQEDSEDFDFTKLEVTLESQNMGKTSCFNTLISAVSTADSGYADCNIRSYETPEVSEIITETGSARNTGMTVEVDPKSETTVVLDIPPTDEPSIPQHSPTLSLVELDSRLKQSKLQFDSLFEKLSLHSAAGEPSSGRFDRQLLDIRLDMELHTEHSVLEDIKEESTDSESIHSKEKTVGLEACSGTSLSSVSDSFNKTYDKVDLPDTDSEDSSYGLNSETMLLRQAPDGAGIASAENLTQTGLASKSNCE